MNTDKVIEQDGVETQVLTHDSNLASCNESLDNEAEHHYV